MRQGLKDATRYFRSQLGPAEYSIAHQLSQSTRMAALDSSHQVMIHGDFGIMIFVGRVVIPGNEIHGSGITDLMASDSL